MKTATQVTTRALGTVMRSLVTMFNLRAYGEKMAFSEWREIAFSEALRGTKDVELSSNMRLQVWLDQPSHKATCTGFL